MTGFYLAVYLGGLLPMIAAGTTDPDKSTGRIVLDALMWPLIIIGALWLCFTRN